MQPYSNFRKINFLFQILILRNLLGNSVKPDVWIWIIDKWKLFDEVVVYLFAWNTCCLTVDLHHGLFKLSVNGLFQSVNFSAPEIVNNRNVSLFNLWTNMEITSQINIYTNMPDEMYGCGKPGNLLAWSGYSGKNSRLFQKFIKEKSKKVESICNNQEERYIMIPVKLKFSLAVNVCRNLGNSLMPHGPSTLRVHIEILRKTCSEI